jgi:hypothetical protein
MYARTRVAFGALVAVLALASAASSSSATRLTFNEGQFRSTWAALRITSGGGTIVCAVTLEGTLHSHTITKVSGTLIGFVTKAIAGHPCAMNGLWFLNGTEVLPNMQTTVNELPWHVKYEQFSGTLPRITSIRITIQGFAYLFELGLGSTCLYRTGRESEPEPFEFRVNSTTGEITALAPDRTHQIRVVSGAFCPVESSITEERSTVTKGAGSSVAITVTLVA